MVPPHRPAVFTTGLGAALLEAQDAGSEAFKWDPATKTVTLELIAGPFKFNEPVQFQRILDDDVTDRAADREVVMPSEQADGTPHSAEVISDEDPMPNCGGDPAIPRAYTNKLIEGLPQEARDTITFTAPASGSFRIFCGVPGHGLSGMWIRFTVDPAAKEAKFETTSPPRARAASVGT